MKKTSLALSAVFAAIVIVQSCQEQSEPYVDITFEEEILQLAQKESEFMKSEILYGNSKVETTKNGEIVVSFLADDKSGLVSQLFILQTHVAYDLPEAKYENSAILYALGNLILKTQNQVYYFHTENSHFESFKEQLPKSLLNSVTAELHGLGLVSSKLNSLKIPADFDFSKIQSIKSVFTINDLKNGRTADMGNPECPSDESECDHGGQYSTSCSIANECSVSCSSPASACCIEGSITSIAHCWCCEFE